MPVVVSARALSKSYGRRHAVRDITFDVEEGSVLGLLGPNGSGKSTILRLLTGYLAPSAGTVSVAGLDVSTHGIEARRLIGYVPEDAPLYPAMRVDDFLVFMAAVRGTAAGERRAAIDAVCRRLGLETVRGVAIGKLSRGYRQRVAIAQALLGNPRLIVLDEPTNGLDPRQIIEMRHLIRDLAREHTVIVTSHILTEIEHVATHVVILLDGRLLTAQPLARGGPGRCWRFELAEADEDGARACALAVAGVASAQVTRSPNTGSLELQVDVRDDAAAPAVAAALVARGFTLRGMAAMRSDLEALFLEATARAPQADPTSAAAA